MPLPDATARLDLLTANLGDLPYAGHAVLVSEVETLAQMTQARVYDIGSGNSGSI